MTINYSAIANLPTLYSVVLLWLPASELVLCPLIIPRHGLHGKHFSSVVLECVFIGPLPSNRCPIVESVTARLCLPSICLTMIMCVTKCWVNRKTLYLHLLARYHHHLRYQFQTHKLMSHSWHRLRSRKPRLTAVGIRCADHATPSIRKSWH
jgi:hypothetical protein